MPFLFKTKSSALKHFDNFGYDDEAEAHGPL